jgi:predicted acetyltransferase
MRIVLSKMYELEMIEDEEYGKRSMRNWSSAAGAVRFRHAINNYFIDYVIGKVIDDLVKQRGYSKSMAEIAVYNSRVCGLKPP